MNDTNPGPDDETGEGENSKHINPIVSTDGIHRKRVLADEINQTTLIKGLPLESNERIKTKHAILPTGHKAAAVQYVGEVNEISSKEYNGNQKKAFNCDDGRLSATFLLPDQNNKLHSIIDSISPPAYVAVTGMILTEERNGKKYSIVAVNSMRTVSKQDRIRFLVKAAHDTLDRIEECDNDQSHSNFNHEKYYSDNSLVNIAHTAKKALERASELSTTENSEIQQRSSLNHQQQIYSLRNK